MLGEAKHLGRGLIRRCELKGGQGKLGRGGARLLGTTQSGESDKP